MGDAGAASLATLQKLSEAGYTFYRDVMRQRADDQFVRNRAADLLCQAGARAGEAAQAARRALPPVTRENPYPDAARMARVTQLREVQTRLAALETRLRGAAALPDRDFSAVLASTAQCDRLVQLDAALLEAAEAAEARVEAVQAAIDARMALSAAVRMI